MIESTVHHVDRDTRDTDRPMFVEAFRCEVCGEGHSLFVCPSALAEWRETTRDNCGEVGA